MTEKLSSPSSLSLSTCISTPPKTPLSTNGIVLVVLKEPPTHVFSEEEFEFDVGVEGISTDMHAALDVKVDSMTQDDEPSVELIMTESPLLLQGKCTIRCRLKSNWVSRARPAPHVRLIISAKKADGMPCCTEMISLVNTKLSIRASEDWSQIWYKDEGGRDKSMQVICTAINVQGEIVKEKIPLQVTLCYAGIKPVPVANQEILRLLKKGRKLQIDKFSGRATLQYRIEDVSKNHQGQDFCLRISASNEFSDVGPGYSPSVSIRSKRNKRARATHSRGSSGGSERSKSPPLPAANHFEFSLTEGVNVEQLRDALDSVCTWADEVVNGLGPLQWHVVGYAQHPDGSPDYDRPFHNMPNPNVWINHVLSSYAQSTRENLRLLQHAIDQAAAVPMRKRRLLGQKEHFHSERGNDIQMKRPAAFQYSDTSIPAAEQSASHVDIHSPTFPPHRHQDYIRNRELAFEPTEIPQRARSDSRENEVEYVLAQLYKSVRTGDRLGFPAYSHRKELLGFYRNTGAMRMAVFIPLSNHNQEFGPAEVIQARNILNEAISRKSRAVHSLKDWGSIEHLLDHCLVYDFAKEL